MVDDSWTLHRQYPTCGHCVLQALWGNYGYQPKTKRIVRIKSGTEERIRPLFVQLALEPLWKAYGAVERDADHKARSRQRRYEHSVVQGFVIAQRLALSQPAAVGAKPSDLERLGGLMQHFRWELCCMFQCMKFR